MSPVSPAEADRRLCANGKIDYLTDPRLAKLTFASIKKHVEATCASRGLPSVQLKRKLLGCATKFAIVAIADEYNVELDTLLDELGPIKTFTPGFKKGDVERVAAKAAEEHKKKLESDEQKTTRLAREKLEHEASVQRPVLADQAAAGIAQFKQEQAAGFKSEYEKYKQKHAVERAERAERGRFVRDRFADEISPSDASDDANISILGNAALADDAADSLADALLDALVAARVPKGTLDVPVRPHARRLPSGRRGISRKMLRAIRRFFRARGALGMLMGDVCKKEGFVWSVCALTRSTGLSLVETLVLTAEARGEVADALIGLATTFFSYSWDGTKLGDMLDAIERRLAELEASDGVTRYVWIDIFAASQTLLAGEFDADRYLRGSEERKARKEDTDHVFAEAMAAISELLLYCSPLTAEWPAPNQPFLLPERGAPPAGWLRRGPGAMTRAWCMFEVVKALAKGATLHVVLAPADVDGFEELLTRRFDEIAGIVAGIDAADAQITKIEDRDYILAEVALLKGGIGAVTATVCASLREWLAAEGRAALARIPSEKRATSTLQTQLGRLLQNLGKHLEAAPMLREALEARRATLGNRHPDTLVSMNNLGRLLHIMGKLDEAGALLREALRIRRATLGDEHRDTLDSVTNLGMLLKDQVSSHVAWIAVDCHWLQWIDCHGMLKDPVSSNVALMAMDCHGLPLIGASSTPQGKLPEAEVLWKEVLEVRRAQLGDRHTDTFKSINNLGLLLQKQGKLDEAEPLLRSALEARRATLPYRHPDMLASMNNLGRLLYDQGRLDEAGVLYREALEAQRATLGDQHPSTLVSISNLGLLLQAQGQLDEAALLHREALEGRVATLGDRHPHTLTFINNLGLLLQDQGKLDEAELLLREALEARREILGDRDANTLISISNLARLLQDKGQLDEADPLMSEAFDGCAATLAEGHRTRLRSQAWLADVRRAQGRIESARALVDARVLSTARAALGPNVESMLMLEAVDARLRCAEGGGL